MNPRAHIKAGELSASIYNASVVQRDGHRRNPGGSRPVNLSHLAVNNKVCEQQRGLESNRGEQESMPGVVL